MLHPIHTLGGPRAYIFRRKLAAPAKPVQYSSTCSGNMPKYTTSDFLVSALASPTASSPKRPAPVMLGSARPSSPSLVHSPGFEPPADTEPFPSFRTVLDLDPVEKAEPLHCMIHCGHDICRNLVKHKFQRTRLPCWCAFEPKDTPAEPCVPVVRLQELDASAFLSLRAICIEAFDDPSQELELRLSDSLTLLHQLEQHMTALALQEPMLNRAIDAFFSQRSNMTVSRISGIIFQELGIYFNRSLGGASGARVISARQLYAELGVYLWTFLWTFSWMTRDEGMARQLCRGDLRLLGRKHYPGPFGVVVSYWRECVDQTVGLVIWRSQQIQLAKQEEAARKANQVGRWFSLEGMTLRISALLG